MREKWNKEDVEARAGDGQAVPQKFQVLTEPMYRPKLLLKSPSMRALKNYNNLSIDTHQTSYDNLSFIPENGDLNSYAEPYNDSSMASNFSDSKNSVFMPNPYDIYDYTTLESGASVKTTTSANDSELDSLEKNDMGSTTKLVKSKMGQSCQTWFSHLVPILCTISLAAGFGNLYRLPQTALIRGGFPFLVAYVVLVLLIGLPLLFLELGIGQLAEEGFIKSWRAVPFFKGVGYVKLIAGCMLSIYYPLYMGLSLYYVIWLSHKPLPFPECSKAVIKENGGYSAHGIDGQHCLRKTFLESPMKDPYWFGIFAAILFPIWIIVIILSIRKTKSFIRSLSILLFPTLACLIALTVKSVFTESKEESLEKVGEGVDWSILKSADVWYYAAIQVFFSTNVGFGSFVTNAGIIYNKVNPLWTALGYIAANLIFGVGSVVICYILSGNMDVKPREGDVAELHLISVIYTVLVKNDDKSEAQIWATVAYCAILFSGFISMATLTYTLLKAITVQNKRRMKWWQTSIVLSFLGLICGCAILLKTDFAIVHLLDHYIVGNLILVSVIIEVFALIAFYGTERIKSDFEFMLGHILSNIWLILWWILPLLLTGIFAWGLSTLSLEGIYIRDPEWLYATGWAVVITAAVFIFVVGLWTIIQQDGYTFVDKCSASFKPSKNWGPKDPMQRHNWVQWNTQSKDGERDFTLKRKGTRDYTRSIKREAKKAGLQASSDLSTKSDPKLSNASTGSYIEPTYVGAQNDFNKPLRITSLVDTMDLNPPVHTSYINIRNSYDDQYKTNMNPLSRAYAGEMQDSSNSEGYGTYRKGPYIIPETQIRHVCHRRFSQSEDATEL